MVVDVDDPPPATPAAVCFDLDDTLYPYDAYARAGLRAAAAHLADRTDGDEDDLRGELFELYFEQGLTEGTFDRLLERRDLPGDLVGELVEAFHGASDPLDPYAATGPVLSRLGADRRLGLVTDGRNGHAKLRRLGIADRFDAVVVAPAHGTSKRAVDPFERVLSALEVPAGATVYVGDDPRVDFRVPNRLGMGTVRLRRGRYAGLSSPSEAAAPDAEIETLDALPGILAEFGGR